MFLISSTFPYLVLTYAAAAVVPTSLIPVFLAIFTILIILLIIKPGMNAHHKDTVNVANTAGSRKVVFLLKIPVKNKTKNNAIDMPEDISIEFKSVKTKFTIEATIKDNNVMVIKDFVVLPMLKLKIIDINAANTKDNISMFFLL